jgi:tRNA pseudouridine13 synthase
MVDLPFITQGRPGLGGKLKITAADFQVEEIPLYEPSGAGEHLYVRLRRECWNTRDLAKRLAKLFGLHEKDVGCAGQKDKQARVIQSFSLHLHKLDPEEARKKIEAELPVEVLDINRHVNKLKIGHLIGNRFTIVLADVDGEDASARAGEIVKLIEVRGLPNYYGVQRFGVDGDNALRGREVLKGRGPKQAWIRRFLLSAWQAERFNRYLAERIRRGWFERLLLGDVAKKTDTGGMFDVTDPEVEKQRFETRDITYTGPIYGAKLRWAKDAPGELERLILDESRVTDSILKRAKLDGSRRPARIFLPGIEITSISQGLVFCFSLPKGSYATSVMREFMKTEADWSESETGD